MDFQSTRLDVRRYGREIDRHRHGHHQIVLPLHGILEMDIDGRTGRVAGHCAAVIPAHERHGCTAAEGDDFLIVDIPAGDFDGMASHGRFWSAAGERPFVRFDPSLGGLCQILAARAPFAAFRGVRSDLAGELVIDSLSRGIGLPDEGLSGPLARAVDFIGRHYRTSITVAAIAKAAGLSESRLYAAFKARFQLSPNRYVARQRLHRAASLLTASGPSIAAIAIHVGYGDQSAFSRAFRREMGMTPAEYRRTNGKR